MWEKRVIFVAYKPTNRAMKKLMKKYSDRLVEIHDEGDDVYWATLKPGWISNLECSQVHERTLKDMEYNIKYAIKK